MSSFILRHSQAARLAPIIIASDSASNTPAAKTKTTSELATASPAAKKSALSMMRAVHAELVLRGRPTLLSPISFPPRERSWDSRAHTPIIDQSSDSEFMPYSDDGIDAKADAARSFTTKSRSPGMARRRMIQTRQRTCQRQLRCEQAAQFLAAN